MTAAARVPRATASPESSTPAADRHDRLQPADEQPGRILVVDDDRRMASRRAEWLCSLGWHAFAAGSVAEAAGSRGRDRCAACLIDAGLPDDGAATVAAAVRAASPGVGIVALLPFAGPLPAWADAAVAAPGRDDELLAAVTAARHGAGHVAGHGDRAASALVGAHPSLRHVLDIVHRVARTPATLLVTGESGTGKSLLARELHAASGRSGRFVEVTCGSLPEPLLESELFGHVAGAFTGATGDRDGRFLQADGGTIFLDEVATASPALQVRLLRVLQEMEFEPVGGSRTVSVDARVVLATHADLPALVAAGAFRADLFWRIAVVTVEMPPLRQRAADIPALAAHFLDLARRAAGREVDGFEPDALAALERHDWPGNVRELRHAIERAVYLGRSRLVQPGDLPPAVLVGANRPEASGPLKEALATPERRLILEALERSGWRRDAAARALGINRTTLYKKLRRLGMNVATLQPGR